MRGHGQCGDFDYEVPKGIRGSGMVSLVRRIRRTAREQEEVTPLLTAGATACTGADPPSSVMGACFDEEDEALSLVLVVAVVALLVVWYRYTAYAPAAMPTHATEGRM